MKKRILATILVLLALVTAMVACSTSKTLDSTSKTLDVVDGVEFNGERISWTPVDNASSYIIRINGEDFTAAESYYVYDAGDKDFRFSIQTIASGEEFSNSLFSNECKYKYLPLVTNIIVQDGIIRWDSVEGATGYQLKVNGVEQDVQTDNSYHMLVPGESTTVFVKAVAAKDGVNAYFSNYSNETIVDILTAPIVTFENSTTSVSWNAVPRVAAYSVVIKKDGVGVLDQTLGKDTTSYSYDFIEAGEYIVEVQAIADSESNIQDSKFSTSLKVNRLASPTYINTQQVGENNNTKVNVTFEDIKGAIAYDVLVNGVEVSLTHRNSFEYDFPNSILEQSHSINIKSRGDEDKVLDSIDAVSFTLIKLSTPQSVVLNDHKIKWDSVSKASGYIVYIDGREFISQTNEIELPSQLSHGVHNIKVKARGNDADIMNSDSSNNLEVRKLSIPDNLEITNNLLSWNTVAMASGYTVYIDDVKQNVNTNSYYIASEDIRKVTTIKVIATGDADTTLDSDFSKSNTIYRLDSPKSLSTTNDNIVWDAVDRATAYDLNIGSSVNRVEGTSFKWADVSEGQKRISVKSIGNGRDFFDSKTSNIKIIEKLAAPAINVNDADDGITWSAVNGVVSYEILCEGNATSTDKFDRNFIPHFTEMGSKSIKVRAVGDSSTVVTSQWTEYVQDVKVASALTGDPAFTVVRGTEAENEFKISVSNPIDGATYKYNVSGKDNITTDTTFTYIQNGAGTFSVKVGVSGDGFNTVDSIYSNTVDFNILTAPTNIMFVMEDTEMYSIKWDNVQEASRYRLEYVKTFQDGTKSEMYPYDPIETQMSVYTDNVKSIEIKVKACGNGSNIFDSVFAVKIVIPMGN